MGFQGTYDPKKVLMTWGPVLFSGFADGTFINAARNNQGVNMVVGSTGDGARAISNDKSGIVTATLLQTSLVNAQLSAIEAADQNNGDGVLPLLIKDLGSTDLVKAGSMWIQKLADYNRGREIGDGNAVWVFETTDLSIFHGGIAPV
jgi:hypothetical protein